MKKLLLFIFILFSIPLFAQKTPAIEMLIFPKYMEGAAVGSRSEVRAGIPYVYRAKITGLTPLTTYRYQNRIDGTVSGSSPYILAPGNVLPGTPEYVTGNFLMPPIGDATQINGDADGTLTHDYGVLTTDASGSYTGWFMQETSKIISNSTPVLLRISLNEPTAADPAVIAYTLNSPADQPLYILNMSSVAKDNVAGEIPLYGTAIRSTPATSGIPKNFVFLYDNVAGTGRPVAGTFIEDDGVASAAASFLTGLGAFYYNNVNGVNGAWGTMILNTDANGIRRIEQRNLADGAIVGYNTSADATWADGANADGTVTTASVNLGTSLDGTKAIVLDGTKVTLAVVKTAQTVTFTNTFPATFKVGDPDFTLSASSTAGLSAFKYTVAPAGILQITDDKVKIIGGGTAIITVTEPGNATVNAGTATKSITIAAKAQAIIGLPQTYAATYGAANIVLAGTGGASGNAIVYTSDDPTIAAITANNQVVIKKSGKVIIRANQLGNANYAAAPEVVSTLTVAKASLNVIAEDKIKTQGSANPAATFVYGAFKNTDNATSVTGVPVLTIAADENSLAGVYDINVDVTGLTSDKYTFNPVKGKLTVEAKEEQIITFSGFTTSATYGSAALPFQVSSNTTNEITFSSSNTSVAVVAKNAAGEWAVTVVGAGEANITASQAEDELHIPGTATQHITIAKAPLSVIAEDKAKLTGEADPAFTARYEGFVNHEDATKLAGTLQFTKQADGSNFLIVPSGLTSNNYALTFINGKLTEGNTAFASLFKTYGDQAFDPGARSLSSGIPVYTVTNTGVAQVNTVGLLEIKGAGTTDVTATFSNGETATASLKIGQATVTVTANPQTRIYAQANPPLTVNFTGFVYGESKTVLSTQPEVFTTATETSPAGNYTITPMGAIAQNYKFSYLPGVLTVTPAALVVKADAKSKLFGQANPAFTLSYSGLAAQDNGAALNLQTIITTTATVTSKVDNYPITVTGLAATSNYTVTYAGNILAVTPAPLTIKANNADKAFGQENPVFTFTYTGFVNGNTASDLTTTPIASTTATTSSPKGTYPITVSGASSPNYAITFADGQLAVKGLQTIAYANLPAVSYGDANFTPAASSDTGVQPVFSSDNVNVAVIENGRVKIIAAGTVNIIASFAATADFVAATASRPLVVSKRTLIVKADSKTKLYGQANPVLTASYNGFVNGETLATALSAPALITTTATPLSPAGTYTISGSAASALNYAITYEPGILTVNKAVLTVTADNKSRAFGLDNPAFTFSYTGFVNAETAAVIANSPLASTVATPDSPAGTYPITLAGASDENYTFNYVSGVLTVVSTTRTITMAAIPVKFVGDADFVPDVVLTSGETPLFKSSDETIATIVDHKIHLTGAGKVTITATAPENVNYSVTPSVSGLLIVTKMPQTITLASIPALKNDGNAYTLNGTASSGLPVTYTVSDPSYVSLTGDAIKGLRIGTVQLTAVQAGNNQYAAAKDVVLDVQVLDDSGDGISIFPALSVNADGKNDFLTIDGIKSFPLNKVTIINRNGIKVYAIEGYDNDQHVFAGQSKSGVMLPQGTYFCLVEYNVNSKMKRKTGYFILKY